MRKTCLTSGYTLIEVMVAMFIFSLLAATVAGSLQSVLATRDKNQIAARELGNVQKAMLLIEEDIEQIINRSITNSIGRREPALQLTKNDEISQLVFTRTGKKNLYKDKKQSGLQRVAYVVEKNTFSRLAWDALDRVDETPSIERNLFKNISDVKWEFIDLNNNTFERWPPSRRVRSRLPRAIEMQVTFLNGKSITRLFLIAEQTFNVRIQSNEK